MTTAGTGSRIEYANRLFFAPEVNPAVGFELAVPESGPTPFTAKETHVKRKIGKKLGLSKETLRTLDEMNLQGAAGGSEGTDKTNACSVCAICLSQNATCMLNTEGICCV